MDLTRTDVMRDILDNALSRSLQRRSPGEFLNKVEKECTTGDELLRAAAQHFKVDEVTLVAEVERFRHINCQHPPVADPLYMPADFHRSNEPQPSAVPSGQSEFIELSAFARHVTLHAVLHEIGLALICEFDLPILGDKEAMADAFATHYLTAFMPNQAVDVLVARATSLMIDASKAPPPDRTVGAEIDNEARRAYQIAALAVAADATKYLAVGQAVGMTEEEIKRANEHGAEIHRSWQRTLTPLWMPRGAQSDQVRVEIERDAYHATFHQELAIRLIGEIKAVTRSIAWKSPLTIQFSHGHCATTWNRSSRTITVHDEYVQRVVEQGEAAETLPAVESPTGK